MDPFGALDRIRDAYIKYVATFQRFKNPTIQDWVSGRLASGTLLFKGPYIELGKRYEQVDSFQDLIDQGLIHHETPRYFTSVPGDPSAPVDNLYRHQFEAIRNIVSGRNTVVATGTGSGKSFCFWVPIVSESLRLRDAGVKGVKAVVVYPMNALANSQYDEFAARLSGSGLKIAIYTGDTKNSREEALASYRSLTGRDKPYDSELISREEIKSDPPDILITNYVMLEYILTRFEDKEIFPERNLGVLRFLVLDEVHTYSGKQGADVAYLIRRLKQRTNTTGKLVCIGTSATVQSTDATDSKSAISEFASRLFGEEFLPESVITETYALPPRVGDGVLPDRVLVTEDMLRNFDGSVERTRALVEALLGQSIPDATLLGMGDLLGTQKTVQFIESRLHEGASELDGLIEEYASTVRPGSSRDECWREIRAAFMAGMTCEVEINGKRQKRMTPKIHMFFSQGREIKSCITREAPHLNDAGETTCPVCARELKRIRKTFPLIFCRACGQEYYGVEIMDDGTLRPRDIDDLDVDGTPAYIFLGRHDPDKTPLPDHWLENRNKVRKDYRPHADLPQVEYCPECNRIYRGADPCSCPSKVKVTVVPYPFLFCPSEGCGVSYDRRPREFNKLFSFGTVGRSTATDVLVSNMLDVLPRYRRKILVFSDNRQDTALQAAHMNNIQRRLQFRRAMYAALKEAGEPVELPEMGDRIYSILEREGVMPDFSPDSGNSDLLGTSRKEEKAFRDYLTFNAVVEIGSTPRKNQPNLEDVGLLKVSYRNFSKLAAKEDLWTATPEILKLSPARRVDYLQGLLDIMRYRLAINYEYLRDLYRFKQDVENNISDEVLFHNEQFTGQPHGFSDTAITNTRNAQVYRISWITGPMVSWTAKVLSLENNRDRAVEIVKHVVYTLKDKGWLNDVQISRVGQLLMINPDVILLSVPEGDIHKVCKRCGQVHHFEELNICTGQKCSDLIARSFADNYFRFEYTRDLRSVVPLNAAEHSAQIDGETRKNLEVRFRDPEDPLNTIVCTPTMELGIDIGNLSAVYMRNVPPSPSNYAQRAGRAGRRLSQPSLVVTFCGVGSRRGPHDQYFYRYPSEIISGEIAPPRFLMDNRVLVRAHIHSIILQTIDVKIDQSIREILDLDNDADPDQMPLKPELRESLNSAISRSRDQILMNIKEALRKEIEEYDWLKDDFIESVVDNFVREFDDSFNSFREEYRSLRRELHYLNKIAEKHGLKYDMKLHRDAIESKLRDMRDGGRDYFTYRYLSGQGLIPNYGFPTKTTIVSLDHRHKHSAEQVNIQRDRITAINEYAPGNSIYYRGGRYIIREARMSLDSGKLVRRLLICPGCGTYYMDGEIETTGGACTCGASLIDQQLVMNAIEMPDQFAIRRQNITSDEEERVRRGYVVTEHYHPGTRQRRWHLVDGEDVLLTLSYEHNGRILRVNSGSRSHEADGQNSGFTLCGACHRWLFGDDRIDEHLKPKGCWRNATKEDIISNLVLYTESQHDVITLDCDPPKDIAPENYEGFYNTLAQAIIQGLQISMNLDATEIATFLSPRGDDRYRIILYEAAEGGTGVLNALQQIDVFHEVIGRARQLLHEFDPEEDQCSRACYGCLCNFYNQSVHDILDRNLVLPFLFKLQNATRREDTTQETRFEELLGRCESDLEKRVLKSIRDRGMPLPDYAQKTIYDGDEPVARPDFYYESERMCVFVDGPDHDRMMESDMIKRDRLESLGYRVFVIRYDQNIDEALGVLERRIS